MDKPSKLDINIFFLLYNYLFAKIGFIATFPPLFSISMTMPLNKYQNLINSCVSMQHSLSNTSFVKIC